jgi:hypothetical protein
MPDSIRDDQQRPDHEDHEHGPHQEPQAPVQVPDYQLESQPIVNGRQPSRPGQPARWEDVPGEREEPGRTRAPERRPVGQHEKA